MISLEEYHTRSRHPATTAYGPLSFADVLGLSGFTIAVERTPLVVLTDSPRKKLLQFPIVPRLLKLDD